MTAFFKNLSKTYVHLCHCYLICKVSWISFRNRPVICQVNLLEILCKRLIMSLFIYKRYFSMGSLICIPLKNNEIMIRYVREIQIKKIYCHVYPAIYPSVLSLKS